MELLLSCGAPVSKTSRVRSWSKKLLDGSEDIKDGTS